MNLLTCHNSKRGADAVIGVRPFCFQKDFLPLSKN
nr:MAG TPA: Putative heavy-metal-binding protein [Caudoviricetes sp.]